MSFMYPLGLLGLIGVPILIIIYIIKNKYTEQTIPSTYIWNYSEKFLKKRKKLPKIAGLISLILQILAVVIISLAIAHPVFTFKNSAYEYCFIIDASGSMSATDGEQTRFEEGKDRISAIIDESMDGGVYTLICVDDSSTRVVFEREAKKKDAKEKLEDIEISYGTSDMTDALIAAQGYFEENPAVKTFLVTDKNYERHDNIELINVALSGGNAALSGAECTFKDGHLTATVNASSYGKTAELEVRLYVDGSDTPISSIKQAVAENTSRLFVFEEDIAGYSSVRFELVGEDMQPLDNEVIVFNVASENAYTTLLVSDTPFFMKSMLEVVGSSTVYAVSTEQYEKLVSGADSSVAITGHSLYIFDRYTPAALPADGSVWLLGQQSSIEGAGFSIQGEVEPSEAIALTLTSSSSSTTQRLIANMQGDKVYVNKYVKYGLYSNFTTLYSYNRQPLVFAGENSLGNRQVVFAFSLHDSNFPLLYDFVPFMRNLISYSFPGVIEKASYRCGEAIEINIPSNCTGIKIDTPMGQTEYPESAMAANQLILDQPGIYTVTLTVGDTQRRYRVFCEMTDVESNVALAEQEFSLQGEAGEGGRDGRYDDLIIFLVVLAVVILIDWGVYCYDKYQLR